ncbi:sprT-like domain-containing protein Spartan isoform X4 [Iris pallida]|uniref:SprT-like domain-containing protein Spartan isoform X4 n=1 Tax=Iris pallida TaxID=29817 RepID=A0AAX6DYB6_IRIPA|nr:sprT-like domain-containing protein Spartan isoform X4 [Iris pallida]
MDEEERATEEPHPDVHQLFCHYNSLYFGGVLGTCFVSWSPSRTTRSTSFCSYMDGVACEIHLSELLLKGRTADDVKNTLLHEMIHAFLYVTSNMKDHSYHGPKFKAKMNAINSSSVTDPQRPSSGYSITIHHQFQKKVDSHIVHHWICQSCGDRIERAMNIPSASDCVENIGHEKSCGNSSCHWHKHKIICSGTYKKVTESTDTKVAELPECKGIRRLSKAKHKDDGETPVGPTHARRHTVRRLQPTEFSKSMADESGSLGIKPSCGTGNGFLSPEREKRKQMKVNKLENEDSLAEGGKSKQTKLLDNEDSLAEGGKSKQMKAIELDNEDSVAEGGKSKQTKAVKLENEDALAAVIPKRARTLGSRKQHSSGPKEKKKSRKRKRDPTEPLINVAIPWLNYYAHESSEEDMEPLTNKRTERRKKRKLLIEQKGRCPGIKSIDGAYSFGDGSCIDSPSQCRGYEQRLMPQTTSEDKRTEDDIVNLSDG